MPRKDGLENEYGVRKYLERQMRMDQAGLMNKTDASRSRRYKQRLATFRRNKFKAGLTAPRRSKRFVLRR